VSRHTRRGFLMTTGLGLVGLSTRPGHAHSAADEPQPIQASIPPHRPIAVPGVNCYPMEHSVAGGETLELCTSASIPSRLSICRLGFSADDSSLDQVLATFPPASSNKPNPHASVSSM
jgi:hypothetical protein